ncbi:MAG: adenylate kinase [Acidimicrobiia bacterium]
MKILFLGPPGAGKGTQAEVVATRLGIAHVSTGDMFRALDPATELGARVKGIMESGELVPDEVVIEMLEARISEPDAADGYILDGFPRTRPQAEALDAHLGEDGLDHVVVLGVPDEELVTRILARGRADDTEAAVRTRLAVYHAETAPLIAFYEPRGIVHHIDGVGPVPEVTDRIVAVLGA